MKKLMMILAMAGMVEAGFATSNVPGDKCRDKNGKIVECKHSEKKDDSKAEKDVKTAGKKTEKGAKHAGYDATHNKATKKMDINEGNEKYQYQDDVK